MSAATFWVGDVRVPFPNHGGTLDPIILVVAHTLECEAIDGLGEDLARGYFQHEAVSVHTVSDPGKTVGGLPSNVRGYHAGANGNARGWANEVTGRAAWTRNDWLGNAKRNKALMQQAKSMGLACKLAGFRPEDVRWLSVAEVRAGNVRGCCYHYDISRAWGQSNHWDPGTGYPADVQMDRIRWYAGVADYWGSSDKNRPDDVTPLPGAPATGGAEPTDWFGMATEEDLRRIIREEMTALNLPAQVIEGVWRRDENDPGSAISIKSSLNTLLDEYQK